MKKVRRQNPMTRGPWPGSLQKQSLATRRMIHQSKLNQRVTGSLIGQMWVRRVQEENQKLIELVGNPNPQSPLLRP